MHGVDELRVAEGPTTPMVVRDEDVEGSVAPGREPWKERAGKNDTGDCVVVKDRQFFSSNLLCFVKTRVAENGLKNGNC